MTQPEQAAQQAAFQQHLREEMDKRAILQAKLIDAQRWAQRTQQEINTRKIQQYAAIVAVDQSGGFGKDGKIPWNYPDDSKWFQQQTKGHICVMGRTTYNDIINHLGDKAAESVLPGRKCFVVTSSPLEQNNATPVACISDVDKHLTEEDLDKTVFFCGGQRIYSEGIAKCNRLLITVVNTDAQCDRFFPVNYTEKYFNLDQVFKTESSPDLRFTVWKRNQQ